MKRSYTYIVLAIFMAADGYGQSCLLANYPFNSSAADVTGNGNDGTVNNAVLTTDRFGNANSAYQFNGSDSYIDLNNNFDLAQRSVNLWVQTYEVHTSQAVIFVSDNPSLNHGFTMIRNQFSGGDTFLVSSACVVGNNHFNPIVLGDWHMVTITVDIDSVRHYLDGVYQGAFEAGNDVSASGGHTTALLGTTRVFDRYFDGKIDDVKIFDCALTEAQIQELYTEVEDPVCLVADYPFNGNALDISGNGYNGSVSGATLTTDRFGNSASAYEFDGISSYIDLNSDFDYPVRTVNLWVSIYPMSIDEGFIYISDNTSLNYGYTQIQAYAIGGDTFVTSGACKTGTSFKAFNPVGAYDWHMVSIVVDDDSVRHYWDGEWVASFGTGDEYSLSGGHTSALLGTSRNFNRHFHGKIDDVKIYSCAMDPADLYEPDTTVSSNPVIPPFGLMTVFPNPTASWLAINGFDDSRHDVHLYNTLGQKFDIAVSGNKVDLSALSPGPYFLVVSEEGVVATAEHIEVVE